MNENNYSFNDFESITPLWRLADSLTVEQAAALIAGFDPNLIRYDINNEIYFENETGVTNREGGHWVQTAFSALKNAVFSGKLKAKFIYDSRPVTDADSQTLFDMMECGEYANPGFDHLAGPDEQYIDGHFVKNEPDWKKTLIDVEELKNWLLARGFNTGFFFQDVVTSATDYLDPKNTRYAPKLAAAVMAWQSVTDPGRTSPKRALEKWLREHAAEFGMTDDDGNPISLAIEECSKVANWQPGGGAPKTPSA